MNRHDLITGLFWLGVSVFFITKALELQVGVFSDPKPGFMLFWSSLIFGILSFVLSARSLIGRGGRTRLADSWMGLTWWSPIITMALLCLYAALLKSIGFLLAMSGLMALLYALGGVKLHVSAAGAILTVLLAYVVFHVALQVPLPRGILAW